MAPFPIPVNGVLGRLTGKDAEGIEGNCRMFVMELPQKSNQLLAFFRRFFFLPGGEQSSVEKLIDGEDDCLTGFDVGGKPLLHALGVAGLGIVVL